MRSMSLQEAQRLRGELRMTGPQPSLNPSAHIPFPKDFPSENLFNFPHSEIIHGRLGWDEDG